MGLPIDPEAWRGLLDVLRLRLPGSTLAGRGFHRRLELAEEGGFRTRLELGSWFRDEDSTVPFVRTEGRFPLRGKLRMGNVLPVLLSPKSWKPVPSLDPAFSSAWRPLATAPLSAWTLLNPGAQKLLLAWRSPKTPLPGILADGGTLTLVEEYCPPTASALLGLVERASSLARAITA